MKDFFEKRRLTKEEAEKEAEKIRDMVGPKGSKEEYQIANELIEEEKTRDPALRWVSLQKERITIIPRQSDKWPMIAFMTEDPKLFQLFNAAAAHVTHKRYGGFHQVGSINTTGSTAWELWELGDTKPEQVVDEIYAKMKELEDLYYPGN